MTERYEDLAPHEIVALIFERFTDEEPRLKHDKYFHWLMEEALFNRDVSAIQQDRYRADLDDYLYDNYDLMLFTETIDWEAYDHWYDSL